MTISRNDRIRIRIYLLFSGYWGIDSTKEQKDSQMEQIANMTKAQRIEHIEKFAATVNKPNPYWNK